MRKNDESQSKSESATQVDADAGAEAAGRAGRQDQRRDPETSAAGHGAGARAAVAVSRVQHARRSVHPHPGLLGLSRPAVDCAEVGRARAVVDRGQTEAEGNASGVSR